MDVNGLLGFWAASAGGAEPGQVVFTSADTWTVPAGVTSICAVCVGGGGGSGGADGNGAVFGGGGGALAYVNDISVTPGENLRS